MVDLWSYSGLPADCRQGPEGGVLPLPSRGGVSLVLLVAGFWGARDGEEEVQGGGAAARGAREDVLEWFEQCGLALHSAGEKGD